MATYIIIDRDVNVTTAGSAKKAYEIFKDRVTKIMAKPEATKTKEKVLPVLNLSAKTRDVLNGEEVIGKIEGLRDASGKGEHVKYHIVLTDGKKIAVDAEGNGVYDYQKELLAALNGGELNAQFEAALTKEVETKVESDEMVMSELTLKNFRQRVSDEINVELFGDDGKDWVIKIHVHH